MSLKKWSKGVRFKVYSVCANTLIAIGYSIRNHANEILVSMASTEISAAQVVANMKRRGISRNNNSSGHYGVTWDKERNAWKVNIRGRSWGRYKNLEDAIARSDEVVRKIRDEVGIT